MSDQKVEKLVEKVPAKLKEAVLVHSVSLPADTPTVKGIALHKSLLFASPSFFIRSFILYLWSVVS